MSVLDGSTGPAGDALVCSARGCTAPATADVRWNNARIHTPERRKHWLACAEHTESLSAYLSARSMLREVVALEEGALPD